MVTPVKQIWNGRRLSVSAVYWCKTARSARRTEKRCCKARVEISWNIQPLQVQNLLNVTPSDRLQLWSHGPCLGEGFFNQSSCVRYAERQDLNQWGCLQQLGFEYVGMNQFLHVFVLLFCWKPLWRSWLKNDDDDGGGNEDAYEY